jgi:hypothetical protein
MFVLYFARDAAKVIDKLVANAGRIYEDQHPARLGTEADFLTQTEDSSSEFEIPSEVDVEKNRLRRRELRDEIQQSSDEEGEAKTYEYSDGLSDSQKLRLAMKHIEILGQVIRNFPGSLPGPDKLRILEATYQLGLRVISALLGILRKSMAELNEIVMEAPNDSSDVDLKSEVEDAKRIVRNFIYFAARISSVSMIMKIASSVGLRDLEKAYAEALKKVGESNATLLIDFAIRLEHSGEIPIDRVKELHELFSDSLLADDVMKILVLANALKYGVDQRTLQQIGSTLKLRVNSPRLVGATRKKSV